MDPAAAAAAAALLPALLAVPVLGAVLVMLLPKGEDGLARGVGLGISAIAFLVSLAILGPYDSADGNLQLIFDKEWIPVLGARFKLGVDGLSIWMVLLTTFLTPIVLLSSHGAIKTRVREFVAIMLILEAGMLGAFLALDLFLFYVFWEVMLIPMYLLIGIWGGQRRLYASIKFVIYTMVGSLLMLVAIFYLYAKYAAVTGGLGDTVHTTDLMQIDKLILPYKTQIWCFFAFALAFAIKVPLFPLHTWLPDAHVEAPTAGSVILAGVLLKFGIYGFLRFALPLFPHGAAVAAPYMMILAVTGIIYGAFVAFAQEDVKKLVAYSSVSHLGFCMLGVFAMTVYGIEGSIFAMISHGLTTSGLFLAIGVIYERRHTRRMSEFGGLWAKMPVFAGMFLICVLGSAGLPGLSGFVGEFLTILGTFVSDKALFPYPKVFAALAASGVIFGAVYLLYMFQKVMFGPVNNPKNENLKDLSKREIAVFVPVVVMIFVLGIFPRPFLRVMEPTVNQLISEFERERALPDGPARIQGLSPVLPSSPADQPPKVPAATKPASASAPAPAPAPQPAKPARAKPAPRKPAPAAAKPAGGAR